MNKIIKHSFEAVSLLTAENGLLSVTIIPAVGQPDWVIPSTLILDLVEYDEYIWTYVWQQQDIAIFHLQPRDITPTSLVILEGNTDVHRFGLQFKGALKSLQVRISDVKDVPLPAEYMPAIEENSEADTAADAILTSDILINTTSYSSFDAKFSESNILSYLFECVEIEGEVYLIPDLDKIAHHLVDLDS